MQQLDCQYLIELAFSEILSGILKTLFDNTYQWYYRFRIKLWNRILCLSMDYSKSGVLFHHFELSNPKNIIHACFFFASSLTKSFSFFKYHNPELVLHKLNFNFYLIRLFIFGLRPQKTFARSDSMLQFLQQHMQTYWCYSPQCKRWVRSYPNNSIFFHSRKFFAKIYFSLSLLRLELNNYKCQNTNS